MAVGDYIKGLGERTEALTLRQDLDWTSLDLTAEEGFLLSRVTPGMSIGEVLRSCGLPEADAIRHLTSLKKKGVFGGRARPKAAEPLPPLGDPKRYDGFIFPPAVMSQPCDLDEALRKEILFRDARRSTWHHYDVLGVRPSTPLSEVRPEYLRLSKTFHPDRYFGKELAGFRDPMNRVFQRIQQAWEVISDPARKAAYDQKTEIALTPEELEVWEAEQDEAAESERRKEERKARLKRRNPFGQQRQKVDTLLEEGDAAAEKGQWAKAVNSYQLARSFDEKDPRVKERLARARATHGAEKAKALRERARSSDAMGRFDEVEEALEEAVQVDPKGVEHKKALVRFYLTQGRKPDAAREVAHDATRLAHSDPEAWTLFGHALVAAGDKREAKAAYQRAVSLDATADEAKEALKRLRWSIF